MTISIVNEQRVKVGSASAELCRTVTALNRHSSLPLFHGGLAHYEKQFPYLDYWPIFEFKDLWIYETFRRKGLGTRALNEVADHFQELGARIGFLKVAPQGDPLEQGLAWRVKLYSRFGWIQLNHHPEERAVYPLMYLPLIGRALTSSAESRLIEIDPDPCPVINIS